ncbi:MAG TPA: AAA family ATPase [Capillimicrobium sp.]|nr:AAA family ATPase [Capillimicrobium sp.]
MAIAGGTPGLRGRERELGELDALVARARSSRSGTLVVSGEAGVGKTALLDGLVDRVSARVQVARMTASEAEVELPYAGLQLLCTPMMAAAARLPAPQREALEAAFGLRDADQPNPFLVGVAVLGLLGQTASERALLCVIDDAQWLDEVSARAVAFVARRLNDEGVAIAMAMRVVEEPFADLPQLAIAGLGDADARELLRVALPGTIDARVRDQLIAESRGNPLALQELPRALSAAGLAGGFALARSTPLESRIEQSLAARFAPLPTPTRMLLLLAAADPTGDPALLWRASEALGLDAGALGAAQQAGALVVGARVAFRHPLMRSAAYGAATPDDRRAVHAALAAATDVERDPDRRAWHRASATLWPDEEIADDLERSAARARTRGGIAAAAAFLERAAELSPDPAQRARRLLAAAEAKHDAGASEAALRLLDSARDHPLTALQEALVARLRARADYTLHRDAGAVRDLLAAAQALEPLDPALARDTYLLALSAAINAGRLDESGSAAAVATAILDATARDASDRALDLILRGQALLVAEGQAAALPTLRRAWRAFAEQPLDALEVSWMWFGARAAQDLWDADAMRTLARRQVELAHESGALTVLSSALSQLMVVHVFDGELDAGEAACDEIDAILSVTGQPLPKAGRLFLAAYRGQADEVAHWAREVRADGHARHEGYALSAANLAEAVLYNGLGRYAEALEAARRELPHTAELYHAMRALLEVVEAATRTGEAATAQEALQRLREVTEPVGDNDWAQAMLALAEAQLADADAAEVRYLRAIELFGRVPVPMLVARSQLLYGELLRRGQRRVDARAQLRPAHEVLSACGYHAFAERAARELAATGETLRARTPESLDVLTDQERNIARLAREGLTNREIGGRLFISARTVEYHLRKVFQKLGIGSRAELKQALDALD